MTVMGINKVSQNIELPDRSVADRIIRLMLISNE